MDIAWIIGEMCNYRSFSNKQIKKKFTHNDSRRVSAKTPSGIDVTLLWIIILNEKQTKQTKNKINKTAKKHCGLPAKLIKDGVLIVRLTKLGKNKSKIPGLLYGVRRSRELLTIKELKLVLRQCKRRKLTMCLSEEDQQKCVGLYEWCC